MNIYILQYHPTKKDRHVAWWGWKFLMGRLEWFWPGSVTLVHPQSWYFITNHLVLAGDLTETLLWGLLHVSCAVRIKCTDLLFPTPGEGQPDPCWTHRASQCCKGAGGTGGGCDLEEGSACRFTVDVFVHISREKQCCDECDSETMSKAVIGMLVDGKCYADSLVCQCWKKSSPGIVNRGDKLTDLDLVSRISSIAWNGRILFLSLAPAALDLVHLKVHRQPQSWGHDAMRILRAVRVVDEEGFPFDPTTNQRRKKTQDIFSPGRCCQMTSFQRSYRGFAVFCLLGDSVKLPGLAMQSAEKRSAPKEENGVARSHRSTSRS